jgi:hypothetical protein
LPETQLASVKWSISAFGKTVAVEVVVFAKKKGNLVVFLNPSLNCGGFLQFSLFFYMGRTLGGKFGA